MNNSKNIRFILLDPYHLKLNGKEVEFDLKENKDLEYETLNYYLEKQLQILFSQLEAPNLFIKVLTMDSYEWQMHSPFDNCIIAYSTQEDFDLKEAGKLFISSLG
jgi:predicted glycosyltransferase involved in capsule biosynthesis